MTIEQLMVNAIDLHVHCGPDPAGQRRVDALQVAQQAIETGMKAVVIKSHVEGTATLANMVNRIVGSPILVGSLAMDKSAGGLNADVLEAQAQAGAKIIWMPTNSAAAHIKAWAEARPKGHTHAGKDSNDGISIIDQDGKLVPQMAGILDVIRRKNLVLATGHVSHKEAFAIAGEALRQRVKVIATHPFARPAGPSMTMEQAQEMAGMGAYIEFCFVVCMPPERMSPADMAGCIKTLGAEHCILSTDFGQVLKPPPAEGFRMMLAYMLNYGLTEDELTTMVKVNPAKLLGLI